MGALGLKRLDWEEGHGVQRKLGILVQDYMWMDPRD